MIQFIRKSLRWKMMLVTSLLIILIFSVNTYQTIQNQKRIFENQIREKVDAYTLLSRRHIVEAYNNYFHSGFIKFKELLLEVMQRSTDVTRIELIDVNGVILFDSAEVLQSSASQEGQKNRVITDPQLLTKICGIDRSVDYHKIVNGEESIEVIYPFVEEWGKHSFSLRYTFSYAEMEKAVRQFTIQMIQSAALFMVLGILAAFLLSIGITGPLNELALCVRQVGGGNLEIQAPIHTRDEIAALAGTFNTMIGNLRQVIQEKDAYAKEVHGLYVEMEGKVQERTRELAEKNALLEETARLAQQADKAKSAFLASMSHELRTPLNSIIGFSGLLLQELHGPLNENERRDITPIYNSARYLLGVINDILDISKIEAGKIDINIETVDLKPVIQQVINSAIGLMKEKSLEIRLSLQDPLPPVRGAAVRIQQVILNLVSNAVKFTQRGYIVISAGVLEDDPGHVFVSVRDSGIGIKPEDQERIFEEFIQLDTLPGQHRSGTGLGLPIARRFIEIMQGRLFVESTWGVGSTFTFTLPRAAEESCGRPGPDERSRRHRNENRSIRFMEAEMQGPWRLVIDPALPGEENMARDAALLRLLEESGQPGSVLRFYRWRVPTLSLGNKQRAGLAADLEFCRSHGIDVVRRPTGGGAVLHHLELTYSVISNDRHHFPANSILETYLLVSRALCRGLALLGVTARIVERGPLGRVRADNYIRKPVPCFSSASHFELLVGERKLIGSAQKRLKQTFLQHGSIPCRYDWGLQAGSMKTPVEELQPLMTCIGDHLEPVPSPDELAAAFGRGFREVFRLGGDWAPEGLTSAELELAARLRPEYAVERPPAEPSVGLH